MNTIIFTNQNTFKLMNDWYHLMISQKSDEAITLKKEIEERKEELKDDKNLLLYYSLLEFRYKVLTNGLGITKYSFEEIETLYTPENNLLMFYYHFFKGIHRTSISSFVEAREQYEKAERLLNTISDEIELGEFYYRVAAFNNYTYKPLKVIKFGNMALDIFEKHQGYEINVGLCKNLLGGICVHLDQYEESEEYFTAAIDTLQKQDATELILRVRNNLGWLYASQNLSTLAIRHLSEVVEGMPNNYKAILLLAREHHKSGETEKVSELVNKGLEICSENDELYKHHFNILKEMNLNIATENIEKAILEGIAYFDKEELHEYTREYTEKLALCFYKEGNSVKASHYFHMQHKAKEKKNEKGALK
ncbi:histidine kinase [Bacillus luti]|uniref:response regulator aspartate phosphatase n=1 Tax=Bacillus luti TaxID=2026191 RepID=UPI0008FE914F|nr:tetratricopeptide repeat protein [Bacillus luti]OJE52727.1 histidine kinase [Bacillus luti]